MPSPSTAPTARLVCGRTGLGGGAVARTEGGMSNPAKSELDDAVTPAMTER